MTQNTEGNLPGRTFGEDLTSIIASKSASVTTVKAISHADFGFTAAQLAAANYVILSAATAGVNMLWDGQDPTATFGHPLNTGFIIAFGGNAKINLLKFTQQSAASTVTITLEH